MRYFFFKVFVFSLCFVSWTGETGSVPETTFSKLLSPLKSVSSDTTSLPLAVGIYLDRGWYTYWQFSDPINSSLKLKWKNPPEGLSFKPLRWPVPQRLLFEYGNQFIYKNFVLLFTQAQFTPSFFKKYHKKTLTLQAELQWLVCGRLCIPMREDLELKVLIKNKVFYHPEIQALFERERKKLPLNTPASASPRVKIKSQGKHWRVQVQKHFASPVLLTEFFPLSKEVFSLKKPKILNGSFLVEKPHPVQSKTSEALVVFEDHRGKKQARYFSFQTSDLSLWWFLLLAFLGGLILNFMPCVLPIVFLKMSNTWGEYRKNQRGFLLSGGFYSLGVVCSFLVLAFLLMVLKQGGRALGWGFQMQSPYFLMFMVFLFLLISLNFMSLFSLSFPAVPFFYKGKNFFKHFLTGMLSTTAASPCTVPFMGAAMAYASQGTVFEIFAVFTFLGLGLASPYLYLSVFPGSLRFIPPPGAWSNHLKHLMAFPMLATSAWMLSLFNHHHPSVLFSLLTGLLVLSFTLWLKKVTSSQSPGFSFLLLVLAGLSVLSPFAHLHMEENTEKHKNPSLVWNNFSTEKIQELKTKNQSVFIQVSAQWCLVCKWNEQMTFQNKKVVQFFKNQKTYLMKGDLTHANPEITSFLEKHQHTGVPFYLYIPSAGPSSPLGSFKKTRGDTNGLTTIKKQEVILPELLSPRLFLKYLNTAHRDKP